ncbi:MAG: hypothetical protein ACREGE_00795 [Candidatus Microsaccharimonas sp.]
MGSTAAPRLTRTDGVLIHDTYEHFNPDKDPNLEEQIAIATTLLDNWLVTRAADYFSQKIYAGEPLDADHDIVYSTVLYPAYKQSQTQFLQESAHTAMEVRTTEAILLEARDSIENRSHLLSVPQLKDLERRTSNLETRAKNGRLTAKTKEAMFRKIDAFLKVDNFENIDEKVDEIVSAARLHAVQQAIRTFESDLRLADMSQMSREQIENIEYKLEALRAEHTAIVGVTPLYSDDERFVAIPGIAQEAVPQVTHEAPTTVTRKETSSERTSTFRGLRQIRTLGGFSTALAAFMK